MSKKEIDHAYFVMIGEIQELHQKIQLGKSTSFAITITTMKKKQTSKKNKKPIHDPFAAFVQAMNEKTVVPDYKGKGIVKGNTLGRMQDFLNQKNEEPGEQKANE